MKRKLLFAGLLAVILLAAASVATARLAGYSLPWWTVDSGGGASIGGDSSNGNFMLSGTIGQPDAHTLSGGEYRLEGGYWGGLGAVAPPQRVYLPLTAKP
jgi:hypothetical protein